MDLRSLSRALRDVPLEGSAHRTNNDIRLDDIRLGETQRSGAMSVIPVFSRDAGSRFMPPLSGLKLSRVNGYGNVELECRAGVKDGVAIVPLHIGYIQDKAQNHALCRSALMASGQKLMFDDACCVQQAQGGYLEGRDQWFFVLPLALRMEALRARGRKDFKKLWSAIAQLNEKLGLPGRGHLEQIICHDRYWLIQLANRFELSRGQTGALFFFDDKLVGIELAPNAEYFAEAWMPLVCFSYGPMAKAIEDRRRRLLESAPAEVSPAMMSAGPSIDAPSVDGIRSRLAERRSRERAALFERLAHLPIGESTTAEDERFRDLTLSTIDGAWFCGQMVESRDGLVYLSLAATPQWLDAAA